MLRERGDVELCAKVRHLRTDNSLLCLTAVLASLLCPYSAIKDSDRLKKYIISVCGNDWTF